MLRNKSLDRTTKEYLERLERFKEMVYEKGYEHAKGTKFRIVKSSGEPFLIGKHKGKHFSLTSTFCLAEDEQTGEVTEVYNVFGNDTLKGLKGYLDSVGIGEFYNIYDRRKQE